MASIVKVNNIYFSQKKPFVLIAGPCVIESPQAAFDIAKEIKRITQKLSIPFIFKASYDKANRTSIHSYRGPGLLEGLKVLAEIKRKLNLPILSDVHCSHEIELASEVLDIIQIPAFLCRQTDLIVTAAKSGKVINIKKGQFLAPWDIKAVIKKMEQAGSKKLLLTERGVSFGYNNLVSDFRSIEIMRKTGYPVIFDATHSVQQPGGLGDASGGNSEFVPLLARCAVAAGVEGIFLETHPNPAKALSDGPNMIALNKLEKLLRDLVAIDRIIKKSC